MEGNNIELVTNMGGKADIKKLAKEATSHIGGNKKKKLSLEKRKKLDKLFGMTSITKEDFEGMS